MPVAAWTQAEDEILKKGIQKYGTRKWASLAALLPGRTVVQVKHRYENSIKANAEWDDELDARLLEVSRIMPTNWTSISMVLGGKTAQQCIERLEFLENREAGLPDSTPLLAATTAAAEHKPAEDNPQDLDDETQEALRVTQSRLNKDMGRKSLRKTRERAAAEAREQIKMETAIANGDDLPYPKSSNTTDIFTESVVVDLTDDSPETSQQEAQQDQGQPEKSKPEPLMAAPLVPRSVAKRKAAEKQSEPEPESAAEPTKDEPAEFVPETAKPAEKEVEQPIPEPLAIPEDTADPGADEPAAEGAEFDSEFDISSSDSNFEVQIDDEGQVPEPIEPVEPTDPNVEGQPEPEVDLAIQPENEAQVEEEPKDAADAEVEVVPVAEPEAGVEVEEAEAEAVIQPEAQVQPDTEELEVQYEGLVANQEEETAPESALKSAPKSVQYDAQDESMELQAEPEPQVLEKHQDEPQVEEAEPDVSMEAEAEPQQEPEPVPQDVSPPTAKPAAHSSPTQSSEPRTELPLNGPKLMDMMHNGNDSKHSREPGEEFRPPPFKYRLDVFGTAHIRNPTVLGEKLRAIVDGQHIPVPRCDETLHQQIKRFAPHIRLDFSCREPVDKKPREEDADISEVRESFDPKSDDLFPSLVGGGSSKSKETRPPTRDISSSLLEFEKSCRRDTSHSPASSPPRTSSSPSRASFRTESRAQSAEPTDLDRGLGRTPSRDSGKPTDLDKNLGRTPTRDLSRDLRDANKGSNDSHEDKREDRFEELRPKPATRRRSGGFTPLKRTNSHVDTSVDDTGFVTADDTFTQTPKRPRSEPQQPIKVLPEVIEDAPQQQQQQPAAAPQTQSSHPDPSLDPTSNAWLESFAGLLE